MMYKLKMIQHSEISKNELNDIIKIKSIAWPYPYDKQIEWINTNLKDSDLHLLLLKNNDFVAYLNLINIKLEIDGIIFDAFGVGNVCVVEKGKGYGAILIKQTNKIIKVNNKIGVLFCKDKLVTFYKKLCWVETLMSNIRSDINTMTYNNLISYDKIIFHGDYF